MIDEIFYWICNMSVVATVTGMIVWGIGHIPRVPARVAHCLWLIPLVRLTIPIGINSRFSLMTWLSELSTVTSVKNVPMSFVGDVPISSMNYIQAAEDYFPLTFKTNRLETVFFVGGIIWLVIALCLLTLIAVLYRSRMTELSHARHWRDDLYICEDVSSPTVFGIFHAKIVLPHEYDEDELTLILRHERHHIRRKDNLWRTVALIVACVHWFNPAVWLFLKSFSEHVELSCDEAVIRRLSKEDTARYARLLLSHVQVRSPLISPLGGGKLKRRITRILSYRKLSAFAAFGSLLLVVASVIMLMTNRV